MAFVLTPASGQTGTCVRPVLGRQVLDCVRRVGHKSLSVRLQSQEAELQNPFPDLRPGAPLPAPPFPVPHAKKEKKPFTAV